MESEPVFINSLALYRHRYILYMQYSSKRAMPKVAIAGYKPVNSVTFQRLIKTYNSMYMPEFTRATMLSVAALPPASAPASGLNILHLKLKYYKCANWHCKNQGHL